MVGATWKQFAETGAVRATAVVVAAGGFVMNDDMVEAYAPRLKALVARGMALGNSFDDGLGIAMGESVGGVAEHMEGAFFTSPFYPPGEALKGIIVNREGHRFVNEDVYHARSAAALFEQPGAEGYLVLDSATMVEPSYGFQPLVDGWESVEEMEQALGMPEGTLVETLRAYNEHAANGEDPEHHKAAEWLTPLDRGPWGAYDLTPGKAFYAGFSLGGLRVSVDGEVLTTDDDPVPGLYAAGACASNIALDGSGYSSGTQLGEASYFGRRAGRHAARGLDGRRSPSGLRLLDHRKVTPGGSSRRRRRGTACPRRRTSGARRGPGRRGRACGSGPSRCRGCRPGRRCGTPRPTAPRASRPTRGCRSAFSPSWLSTTAWWPCRCIGWVRPLLFSMSMTTTSPSSTTNIGTFGNMWPLIVHHSPGRPSRKPGRRPIAVAEGPVGVASGRSPRSSGSPYVMQVELVGR